MPSSDRNTKLDINTKPALQNELRRLDTETFEVEDYTDLAQDTGAQLSSSCASCSCCSTSCSSCVSCS